MGARVGLAKLAALENMGTLPTALSASAMRRARSSVPLSSASQPGPPAEVQFGMFVAWRPHGVIMSYAQLKQS
jgi:hypothetical protein